MEGVPSAAESMEGVPEAMLAVAAPGPPTLLKIFLVRARGLPIMDKHIFSKGGSSDPMVLLRVGSEERKSTCKKKTLEPLWGEAFEVGVDDAVDSLVLEVRDVDLARTEFMGRVAIPLEPLAGGEPQRAWYALLDKNGQAGGEVECVLRWIHDAAFAYALPAAFSAPVVRGPPNLLCVLLVRARGLAVMDKNVLSAGGSSDPVATFAVRGSGGASVRSSVRKKTLSPDWMEDFDLEAEEDGSRLLEFTLEDADVGRREFMGQFQIDLDAGRGGEVKRAWHALLDKDGGPAMGRVDLALRWVHDPSRVIQLPFSQREAHPLKAPNLLRVFLIRARGLAVMDRNLLSKGGSSDPVVSFEMRGHGGKRQTSKVKKKCLAPKWLESFEVDCDEADGFVDFTVEDYDRARGNDFMGTFSVDVHDLVSRQTCRRWHNLCNADGTAAQGDVEVALRWEHEVSRVFELPAALTAAEAHPDLPANTLRIYLVRARGLAAMDTSLFSKKGTSDPFVTFEHRGDVQKSKVKPKTLAPTWLESFEFAFEDGAVTLTVEDYDVASSADFMGRSSIPLDALRDRAVHRGWHALCPASGGADDSLGRVELAIRWVHERSRATELPDDLLAEEPVEVRLLQRNVVVVCVLRARGLPAMDWHLMAKASSDPLVTLALRGGAEKRLATAHRSKTLNPVWMETLQVPAEQGIVDVVVEDRDVASGNDFMGSCAIDLVAALGGDGSLLRAWFPLTNKGAGAGEVELAMRWLHDAARTFPLPPDFATGARGEEYGGFDGEPNALKIFLVRGRGLSAAGKVCYPRVTFEVDSQRYASTHKAKTQAPSWSESFELRAEAGALHVSVDAAGGHADIGGMEIDLETLADGRVHRKWYTLAAGPEAAEGAVELALLWYCDARSIVPLPPAFVEPEAETVLDEPPNLVKIFVVKARHLAAANDSRRGIDARVTLRIGDAEMQTTRKLTARHPTWGESFEIAAYDGVLTVAVDAAEAEAAPLGACSISLADALGDRDIHRGWWDLQDGAGACVGKVQLGLRWIFDAKLVAPVALPGSFTMTKPTTLLKNGLRVCLIRGYGLPAANPFVVFEASFDQGGAHSTARPTYPVSALEPTWLQTLDFTAEEGIVTVTVYDDAAKPRAIGHCAIKLDGLADGRVKRRWYRVSRGKSADARLEFALQWYHDAARVVALPGAFAPALPGAPLLRALHAPDAAGEAPNVLKVVLIRTRGIASALAQPRARVEYRGAPRCRAARLRDWLGPAPGATRHSRMEEVEVLELEAVDADGVVEITLEAPGALADVFEAPASPRNVVAAKAPIADGPVRGCAASASFAAAAAPAAADASLDSFIGKFEISMARLSEGRTLRDWFDLGDRQGLRAGNFGKVEVAMRWVFDAKYVVPLPDQMAPEIATKSRAPAAAGPNVLQCFVARAWCAQPEAGHDEPLGLDVWLRNSLLPRRATRNVFGGPRAGWAWAECFELETEDEFEVLQVCCSEADGAGPGHEGVLHIALGGLGARVDRRWHSVRRRDGRRFSVELGLRWVCRPVLAWSLPHELPSADALFQHSPNALILCVLRARLAPSRAMLLKGAENEAPTDRVDVDVSSGGERRRATFAFAADEAYSRVTERFMVPLWADGGAAPASVDVALFLTNEDGRKALGTVLIPLSLLAHRRLHRGWFSVDDGDVHHSLEIAAVLVHDRFVAAQAVKRDAAAALHRAEVLATEAAQAAPVEVPLDPADRVIGLAAAVPRDIFYAVLGAAGSKPRAQSREAAEPPKRWREVPRKKALPTLDFSLTAPALPVDDFRDVAEIIAERPATADRLPGLGAVFLLGADVSRDDAATKLVVYAPLPTKAARQASFPGGAVSDDDASASEGALVVLPSSALVPHDRQTAREVRLRKKARQPDYGAAIPRRLSAVKSEGDGVGPRLVGAADVELARRRTRVALVRVGETLERVQRSLPVDFLASQDMHSAGLQKAVRAVYKAASKNLRAKAAKALALWKEFLKLQSHRGKVAAAVKIQAAWQTKKGQGFLATVRRARLKELERKAAQLAKVLLGVSRASHLLHRTLLRAGVRRRMRLRLKRRLAAQVVIDCYKNKVARAKGLAGLASFMAKRRAVTKIATAWRGKRARLRYLIRKTRDRHRKTRARFSTARLSMAYNFEQHGAAEAIQRWFNALPGRAASKAARERWRAITLVQRIQRRWRLRYEARKRLRQARRDEVRAMDARRLAALRLKTAARTFIVRAAFLKRLRALRDSAAAEAAETLKKELKAQHQHRLTMFISLHPLASRKHKRGMIFLQALFRGFALRRRLAEARLRAVTRAARFLARWMHHRLLRRRRRRAGLLMARTVARFYRRAVSKRRAATTVQSRLRRFLYRRRYVRERGRMRRISQLLLCVARGVLARRRFDRRLAASRRFHEVALSGKLQARLSRAVEVRRQLLVQSLQFLKAAHLGELQRTFAHYSALGNKGNTQRLGVSNFSKIFKDAGLSGKLSSSDVELAFMRCRGKAKDGAVESHLHYAEFIRALRALADLLYKNGGEAALAGRLARHYGAADARLVSLVERHVVEGPAAARVRAALGSKTFAGRADAHLARACGRIQHRWRRRVAQAQAKHKLSAVFATVGGLKRVAAACLLQRILARGAAGRSNAAQRALLVYDKYVDGENKRSYWYNPRTSTAKWVKPKALRTLDVGNPVQLPEADLLYEVRCAHCARRTVATYCVECDDLYCEECDLDPRKHNEFGKTAGERRRNSLRPKHARLGVDACVQCRFQVGTRFCDQCRDSYCDTCYADQHSKGSLQNHTFEPLVPVCDDCGVVAARKTGGPLGRKKLCIRDAKKRLDLTGESLQHVAQAFAAQGVKSIPYVPRSVRAHFDKLAEDLRSAKIATAGAARTALLRGVLEEASAVTLQRVWRGARARSEHAGFLTKRKAWLVARQAQGGLRQSKTYLLKCFLGMGPLLESDTAVEAVEKRVPYWKRDTVRDVVGGDWLEFAGYVRRQDQFEKDRGAVSLRVAAPLYLARAKLLLEKRRRVAAAQKQRRAVDVAQALYRTARASKSNEAEQRRAAMRFEKKQLVKADAAVGETDDALETWYVDRDATYGPRELQRRVAFARKCGAEVLGLRLLLQRGSAFADASDGAGDSVARAELDKQLRVGVKFRLVAVAPEQGGNSEKKAEAPLVFPLKYRTVANTGRPNLLETFTLQVRRALAASYLRLIEASQELVGDDEEDGAEDWRAKAESDQIAFEAKLPKWVFDERNLAKLRLSRVWTHADAADLRVYRLPVAPAWERLAAKTADAVRASPLLQVPVKAEVSARATYARLLLAVAARVDDGSATQKALQARAQQQREVVSSRGHLIVGKFDADVGFGLASATVSGASALQAAAQLPLKLSRDAARSAVQAFRDSRDPVLPWAQSVEKTKIFVSVQQPDGEALRLGDLEIDVRCPAHLARELLRRDLYKQFNAAKMGATFDFLLQGAAVAEADERTTRLKLLAPQRIDAQTREIEHVLFVQAGSREYADFPRYKPPKGKAKLRKIADDTGLWSDDEGDKKKKKGEPENDDKPRGDAAPTEGAAPEWPQADGDDQQGYAGEAAYDDQAYEGYDDQAGYDQTAYDQTGYDQTGYDDQTGYEQATYDQTAYDQATYDQTAYDQTAYDQASAEQGDDGKQGHGYADYDQQAY